MKKLIAVADKIWNAFTSIAIIFMVGYTLLIIVNIITRKFFNYPIFGSTEIVKYASLIVGALALAQNEWFDGNIQMTLLLEKISDKANLVIQFVDYAVCSVAFVYITYLLGKQTLQKFANNDATVDLHLQIGIFAGVLTLGFAVLTICLFIKTIVKGYELFNSKHVMKSGKYIGEEE